MRTNPVAALDWRKARRKRAWELHAQGWSQRRIAQAFGVSQAAVSRWLAAGQGCLGVGSRHGAAPKLDAARLRLLPDLLSHGAEVWGFRGELWTCARVAAVIQEEFGVTYSRAHVSRLLKALDWTPQKPIERASQRPIHRFRAMRAFQASDAAKNFVFEALPAYAPDLNLLDTGIWHLLKDVALANVCGHNSMELRAKLTAAIVGLRCKPHLIRAAFAGAKLALEW